MEVSFFDKKLYVDISIVCGNAKSAVLLGDKDQLFDFQTHVVTIDLTHKRTKSCMKVHNIIISVISTKYRKELKI